MTTLTVDHSTSAGSFSGIRAFFGTFFRALQANRMYHALSSLSDRQLAEMGMTRQDIPARVALILDGEA